MNMSRRVLHNIATAVRGRIHKNRNFDRDDWNLTTTLHNTMIRNLRPVRGASYSRALRELQR